MLKFLYNKVNDEILYNEKEFLPPRFCITRKSDKKDSMSLFRGTLDSFLKQ